MLKSMHKIMAMILLSSIVMMLIPMTSMAEVVSEPVNIQQETGISPRLAYIVEAMADLDIANNVATVDCWVKGRYGDATKAKVIADCK